MPEYQTWRRGLARPSVWNDWNVLTMCLWDHATFLKYMLLLSYQLDWSYKQLFLIIFPLETWLRFPLQSVVWVSPAGHLVSLHFLYFAKAIQWSRPSCRRHNVTASFTLKRTQLLMLTFQFFHFKHETQQNVNDGFTWWKLILHQVTPRRIFWLLVRAHLFQQSQSFQEALITDVWETSSWQTLEKVLLCQRFICSEV